MTFGHANYEKDTLGFYFEFCRALFGPESAAVKYLEAKAEYSPEGFHEKVAERREKFIEILNELDTFSGQVVFDFGTKP